MTTMAYDSRPETIKHSRRVEELMVAPIGDLLKRSREHDLSKIETPEVQVFDKFTPLLRQLQYGSPGYKDALMQMGPALVHHYAANRHHPEHFGDAGMNGMTLVDLIEMLADWRASTERTEGGSLRASLPIQKDRFGISDQLYAILINTAVYYGYVSLEEAEELREPRS